MSSLNSEVECTAFNVYIEEGPKAPKAELGDEAEKKWDHIKTNLTLI